MTEILETKKIYFRDDDFILIKDDCIKAMKKIKDGSVNMIFADPPYFLSNGGITCNSGKMVSVNKASWDVGENINEIHKFNLKWLKECKRILHHDGSIWVSGTFHNIYSLGFALQNLEYKILNNVTWAKTNPPPNLGCRCFTHSTETILWAKKSIKSKHYFNYSLMKQINDGKQMKDKWEFPSSSKKEKECGAFPTQKPLALLERIILASSNCGDVILDPFNGSGTTGIACKKLSRRYIGIDREIEYLDLTIKRYYKELNKKSHL